MSKHKRTILVTGASSGIGAAICQQLLDKQYSVIGVARDFKKLDIQHNNFNAISLDLMNTDTIKTELDIIAKQHNIDGLICCAGQGRFGSLEEFSMQQIQDLININLTSQIIITRALLPTLKSQNSSDIIFIGSEAALKGGKRGAVYSASKFGLRGFTQALREECASANTRICIINPGMVKTPFFDELDFAPGDDTNNYIKADDVATTVLHVLNSRPETVIDEINLSPLKKVIQKK